MSNHKISLVPVLRNRLVLLYMLLGVSFCFGYAFLTPILADRLLSLDRFEDQELLGRLVATNHVGHACLLLLFTVFLAPFLPKFPKPFFVLWFFAWLSWFFMYAFHASAKLCPTPPTYLDTLARACNGLNSGFFLLSGLTVLLPRHFSPPPDPGTRFIAPLRWVFRFIRRNRLCWVVLPGAVAFHVISPSSVVGGVLSIVAILTVGLALTCRVFPLSARISALCIFVHIIYLIPQVNSAVHGTSELSAKALMGVWGPALILKPVLGMFLVLLLFRETISHLNRSQRTARKVLNATPVPILVLSNREVLSYNAAARRILNLPRKSTFGIDSLFNRREHYNQFLLRLAKKSSFNFHCSLRPKSAPDFDGLPISVGLQYIQTRPLPDGVELGLIVINELKERRFSEVLSTLVHDYIKPRLSRVVANLRVASKELMAHRDSVMHSLPDAMLSPISSSRIRSNHLSQKPKDRWRIQRLSRRKSVRNAQRFKHAMDNARDALAAAELIRSEYVAEALQDLGLRDSENSKANLMEALNLAWTNAKRNYRKTIAGPVPATEMRFKWVDGTFTNRIESRQLIYVRGERQKLHRVFLNLFTNALEALAVTEEASEAYRVDVEVKTSGKWVSVVVEHDGKHVPEQIASAINDGLPCDSQMIGIGLLEVLIQTTRWHGQFKIFPTTEGTRSKLMLVGVGPE